MPPCASIESHSSTAPLESMITRVLVGRLRAAYRPATPQPGRTFLISESCRGEGAILLNAAGERFTDELQPRDVVRCV